MASVDERQLSDELADIDLNDPELAQAASKIQKQFRGFKKASGDSKKPVPVAPPPPVQDVQGEENPEKKESSQDEEDELADIDLTDPELEKAAVKIQSTFKGFKTRRAPQN